MSTTLRDLLNHLNSGTGTVRPGWPPFHVWQRRQAMRRRLRRVDFALKAAVASGSMMLPRTNGCSYIEERPIPWYNL